MSAPERLLTDAEVLRLQGHDVGIVEEGTRFHVVISNFLLPSLYEPQKTDLMFIADYQYPMSALDMFWTEPFVRCRNGSWPQNADQFEQHIGRTWQRWSWHYQGWNPSSHSLATHLDVCFDRLSKGL